MNICYRACLARKNLGVTALGFSLWYEDEGEDGIKKWSITNS